MADWLTREQRSRNMSAIRSSGTKPELRLGAVIGTTFPRRRVVAGNVLPGKPEYFLPGAHLAVFLDGCFWHSCPKHGRIPDDNRDYWEPKLARNRTRDRAADRELRRMGIRPLRVWEHDLRGSAAKRGMVRVAGRLRRAVSR